MLRGQVAVFVSCSEKFKETVAWPVRDALAARGLRPIVMADEPPLPGTGGGAEPKAGPYLDASSALVALCTADYELSDGSRYPRANIVDEIAQARSRPHLRDRCQVLRSPGVLLPSDITPSYDDLDVARPDLAAEVVLKQLQQWGMVPAPAAAGPHPVSAGADDDTERLFDGLPPGDHDEARRRLYPLLRDRDPGRRRQIARDLHRVVTESGDHARALAAASLLAAAAGLDPALVPAEMVETLAGHPGYLARSCAAGLLRDRAALAPLDVPVEVLGRLAVPSTEDWLVWAPAMAAVQELATRRRDALVILEALAASADLRDRHAAATALLAVAQARPAAVDAGLAGRLAGDPDPLVAARAAEVMTALGPGVDRDGDGGAG